VTIFWLNYGPEEEIGAGASVRVTPDGGFVTAGWRAVDFGLEPDAYLVKTGADGVVEWERTLGLPGNDFAYAVEPTADDGFIVVGESPALDVTMVRTDAQGDVQWSRVHARPGSEWANDVRELPGGGFVVVGTGTDQGQDLLLLRTDPSGDILPGWPRLYGGAHFDVGHALVLNPDGTTVIAGQYGGGGATTESVWLLKTDADGDVLWSRTYGPGRALGVASAPGGGFIVSGAWPGAGGKDDALLLAVDADGFEEWRKRFGGDDHDDGREVTVTSPGDPDPGYVMVGRTLSFTPGTQEFEREDLFLIRVSLDGATRWQKVKGKSDGNSELAAAVDAVPDGGFIVGGAAQARMLLAKLDKNGDTVDLGDLDVSLDIPDAQAGVIRFSNAEEIARTAVGALFLPRQAVPFAVDLVIDEIEMASFCGAGGTVTVTPDIPPLLTAQSYEAVFAACVRDPADPVSFEGILSFLVTALAGDPTTQDYALTESVPAIDLDVTDDAGTTTISGAFSFTRTAAGGDVTDLAQELPGNALVIAEGGTISTLTQFDVEATFAAGVHSLGPAHVELGYSGVVGPLSIDVTAGTRLEGPSLDLPAQGTIEVEAADGSTLRITILPSGVARLDVDTDADGTIDGSLSTDWDDLL